MEKLKNHFNRSLKGLSQKQLNDYTAIRILLLYWDCEEAEDGNKATFKSEAHGLESYFRSQLNYKAVEHFPIPTSDSQLSLGNKIGDTLISANDPSSLLIIHYGGHGDEDIANGGLQRSVWSAYGRSGGPSLKWHEIQPTLELFYGHVLLVLDCCYAGQAFRAPDSVVPSNVEVLAACGMGRKTPLPGPYSFTAAFTKALSSTAHATGYTTTRDIFKTLAQKDAGLPESPIFVPLAGSRGSIRLKSLASSSAQIDNTRKEVGSISLDVVIGDPFEKQIIEELIVWLRDHAPQSVSHVLVSRITSTSDYVHQPLDRGGSAAALGSLSSSGQENVSTSWAVFMSTIAGLTTRLRLGSVSNGIRPRLITLNSDAKKEFVVQELKAARVTMERTIEQNIFSEPGLLEDKHLLQQAIEDPTIQRLGLTDLCKIRLLARFPSEPTSSSRLNGVIKIGQGASPLAPSLVEGKIDNLSVIIEYKQYDRASTMTAGLKIQEERMKTLAEVLSTPKSSDFHTWKCIKWCHEPTRARYGLIFEYPKGYSTLPVSLFELIKRDDDRPSLAQRFAMAEIVGRALQKWHTAGWVHQGISSHNIMFFHPPGRARIDYSSPYLCGFEFMRQSNKISLMREVEDFSRDVYRHPERQGIPTIQHTKKHDIYSLGVVMTEIGLWDLFEHHFAGNEKISPAGMSHRIRENLRSRLPFYMGETYKEAAEICMSGEFPEEAKENLEIAFESRVLSKINSGRGL